MRRFTALLTVLTLAACAEAVPDGVTVVGSPEVGPKVAGTMAELGIPNITQAFEGAPEGAAAFCAGEADVLIIARPLEPGELDSCGRVEFLPLTIPDGTIVINNTTLVAFPTLAEL